MPSGFDWDEGNWPKCAKHGLTKVDVESVFDGSPSIFPARDAADETRRFAVGRNTEGRYVFIVFTLRDKDGASLIRPISARFMHEKEVRNYEQQKGTQDIPEAEDGR
jgi:uncharacterized DUF497 family protein